MGLRSFNEIWAVDFEFTAPDGHRPVPICMVAIELLTGRMLRLNEEQLHQCRKAPFDTGYDSLFIAYYASAEFGCFLALGWPLPVNVIDLYGEFRNLTNGLTPPYGDGLLGALLFFGLTPGNAAEKADMRALAIRGGPYTGDEISGLIEYCGHDVEALAMLWPVMEPRLDGRSLLRGRYMKAAALMEWNGIPIDTSMLTRLDAHWDGLKDHLVCRIDPVGEIWQAGKFSEARFAEWLMLRGIPWPSLPSGRLQLDKDTWSDMGKCHPLVRPLAELRATLSKLRLTDLAVGPDGRNRAMLSAFRSKTGRNQPSTSRFIFGSASWIRSLIRPAAGYALAYIDWCQQEFGIGAVLSGDSAMLAAYTSSDPYLAFAKMAGAVPQDATKASHPDARCLFKMVVLGVGYSMTEHGLAPKLNMPLAYAKELLEMHRRCFPGFWQWSQGASDFGQLHGRLHTRFGWLLHVTATTKDRTLRNFPCQANGAEMMRLAAIYAMEAGIKVCAPVHDAFLIEAPVDTIEHEVVRMQACMARASADVLEGFQLNTEVDVIRHPDRFGGGANRMWQLATKFVTDPSPHGQPTPSLAVTPA